MYIPVVITRRLKNVRGCRVNAELKSWTYSRTNLPTVYIVKPDHHHDLRFTRSHGLGHALPWSQVSPQRDQSDFLSMVQLEISPTFRVQNVSSQISRNVKASQALSSAVFQRRRECIVVCSIAQAWARSKGQGLLKSGEKAPCFWHFIENRLVTHSTLCATSQERISYEETN